MPREAMLDKMCAAFIAKAKESAACHVHVEAGGALAGDVCMDGFFNIEDCMRAAVAAMREPSEEVLAVAVKDAICADPSHTSLTYYFGRVLDAILAEKSDDQNAAR